MGGERRRRRGEVDDVEKGGREEGRRGGWSERFFR